MVQKNEKNLTPAVTEGDSLLRASSEDISTAVNSIGTGAIFLSRLGHDLSRNVGGMSVYAL